MPVVTSAEAETFALHGSVFRSFVAPSRGSSTLCAWHLEVTPGTVGVAHRPDREEVLLVLTGALTVDLDGTRTEAGPGDVVLVPAGSRLTVSGGPDGATAWVTTTPGLTATTDDGAVLTPPWAR